LKQQQETVLSVYTAGGCLQWTVAYIKRTTIHTPTLEQSGRSMNHFARVSSSSLLKRDIKRYDYLLMRSMICKRVTVFY